MSVQERDYQAPKFLRDDWEASSSSFHVFLFFILGIGTVVTAMLGWLLPALI
nr:hypothetical protein [Mesorhizobium loti]